MSIVHDLIECVAYTESGIESCIDEYCDTSTCSVLANELDDCVTQGWMPEDGYETCSLNGNPMLRISQAIEKEIQFHQPARPDLCSRGHDSAPSQNYDIVSDLILLGMTDNPYNIDINPRTFTQLNGIEKLLELDKNRNINILILATTIILHGALAIELLRR